TDILRVQPSRRLWGGIVNQAKPAAIAFSCNRFAPYRRLAIRVGERTPPMRATPDFDFGLGDEAAMIRETVARFADEQIAPRAEAIDREDGFPRDLWPAMGELGLHGVTVPEADGGLGL